MTPRSLARSFLDNAVLVAGPFGRLVGLAWSASSGYLGATVLLRIAAAFGPLLVFWIGKEIFDLLGEVVSGRVEPGVVQVRLLVLVGAEALVVVLLDLLGRASGAIEQVLGEITAKNASAQVMGHAARLNLGNFDSSEFHNRLERAKIQARDVAGSLQLILSAGESTVMAIVLLVVIAGFEPILFVPLVLALVPSFVAELHYGRKAYALARRWTPEQRELDYLMHLATDARIARELRSFDFGEYLVDRFRLLAGNYVEDRRRLLARRSIVAGCLSSLSSVFFYSAYGLVVLRTIGGILSLGDLTLLMAALRRTKGAVSSVLVSLAKLLERRHFMVDLFSFLDTQPTGYLKPVGLRPAHLTRPASLRFVNVGFRYPGTDLWAVRNVTCSMNAGEIVGIAGPNGCGKSTLIKLILRLYDPSEGQVLLDDVDIRGIPVRDYRKMFGVHFQGAGQYFFTVAENLTLADKSRTWDIARMQRAADSSGASVVIDKLERGYDQVLGRIFEDGIELSGGEWQRLALARAMLAESPILVLDEPTAGLDIEAERNLCTQLQKYSAGRIIVLASHRQSTLQCATRVMCMDHGSLEESAPWPAESVGSHCETRPAESGRGLDSDL